MLSRALRLGLTKRSSPIILCNRVLLQEDGGHRTGRIILVEHTRETRSRSLNEKEGLPKDAGSDNRGPRAPTAQNSDSGHYKKLEILPSWMRPHLEVIGTALRTIPAEVSAKAGSVSRTGCLITLWELTLALVRNLGFGYKWAVALVRLVLYATLLLPGFVQIGFGYFFKWKVKIGVPYGSQPRNFMDLYMPPNAKERRGGQLAPVVVFVTGGAWIIGYRAWGALLARRLSQRGALVCSIDYRNFPQGTIVEMLHDCDKAFQWVAENVEIYGGNPDNVFIVGQSAGAHISSLCLFAQAQKVAQTQAAVPDQHPGHLESIDDHQQEVASLTEAPGSFVAERLSNAPDFSGSSTPRSAATQEGGISDSDSDQLDAPLMGLLPPSSPQANWKPADEHVAIPTSPPAVAALGTAALSWQLRCVRGFFGISGAYDMTKLEDVLDKRGLHRSLLARIMNVSELGSLDAVSPTRVLAGLPLSARALLPSFGILHGDSDMSVPPHIADAFAAELQAAGLLESLDMRHGKSHTQVFIEDPFKGDDYMCEDISEMVFGRRETVHYRPLVFKWLIDTASFLCPF